MNRTYVFHHYIPNYEKRMKAIAEEVWFWVRTPLHNFPFQLMEE